MAWTKSASFDEAGTQTPYWLDEATGAVSMKDPALSEQMKDAPSDFTAEQRARVAQFDNSNPSYNDVLQKLYTYTAAGQGTGADGEGGSGYTPGPTFDEWKNTQAAQEALKTGLETINPHQNWLTGYIERDTSGGSIFDAVKGFAGVLGPMIATAVAGNALFGAGGMFSGAAAGEASFGSLAGGSSGAVAGSEAFASSVGAAGGDAIGSLIASNAGAWGVSVTPEIAALGMGAAAGAGVDVVGSDWSAGAATGKTGGLLETTADGLTAGNTAAASGVAGSVNSGIATAIGSGASDVFKTIGKDLVKTIIKTALTDTPEAITRAAPVTGAPTDTEPSFASLGVQNFGSTHYQPLTRTKFQVDTAALANAGVAYTPRR